METDRKLRRRTVSVALLLGILVAPGCAPITPAGRFGVPDIGSGGLAFFEFHNGEVNLIIPTDGKVADGCITNRVGSYMKEGDQWVFTSTDGYRVPLKPSLFVLEFHDPVRTNIFGRMLLPPR